MVSLYFHIPFCAQNCKYCSFSVVSNATESMVQTYLQRLHEEIELYGKLCPKAEIKTLYFGGGTPSLIGEKEMISLIEHCEKVFNFENIGELSIECNPYPQEEVLHFVDEIQKKYHRFPRVRFSFGLQTFDNEILVNTGRNCSFPGMVDFLRNLQPLKKENSVYNFDFIAFGKFHTSKKGNLQLRTPSALDFFYHFVQSWFADSFSLYTLELFEHQQRKKTNEIDKQYFGNDDEIYEEFDFLKNTVNEAWYLRYEISNFSKVAKSSIHNRVYREMEDYLGLGVSASSFLSAKSPFYMEVAQFLQKEGKGWLRFTNTPYFPKYLSDDFSQMKEIIPMEEKDFLIEKFFLGLRTDQGVKKLQGFEKVLVSNREEKIQTYEKQGFLIYDSDTLILTDKGMNVYNQIVTELLEEI